MVMHQGMTVEVETKNWRKAGIIPPRNNILIHFRKAFVPSYEKERRPNMYKILSNAYQKEWHAQQSEDYRTTQARQSIDVQVHHRRYFRRKKSEKVKVVPIIKLRRFSGILGKVDTNLGLEHTPIFDEKSMYAENNVENSS